MPSQNIYIFKDALAYFFQIFWKGLEYPTGKLYIPNFTQEYDFPFNWKRTYQDFMPMLEDWSLAPEESDSQMPVSVVPQKFRFCS